MVLCRKKIWALPYYPILVWSLLPLVFWNGVFSLEYVALQADAFSSSPVLKGAGWRYDNKRKVTECCGSLFLLSPHKHPPNKGSYVTSAVQRILSLFVAFICLLCLSLFNERFQTLHDMDPTTQQYLTQLTSKTCNTTRLCQKLHSYPKSYLNIFSLRISEIICSKSVVLLEL